MSHASGAVHRGGAIFLIAYLLLPTPVLAQQRPESLRNQAGRPGIAVDAKGGPVIDPTKNVLDLVEAAIRRQDDLRAAEALRQDALKERQRLDLVRPGAQRKRIASRTCVTLIFGE